MNYALLHDAAATVATHSKKRSGSIEDSQGGGQCQDDSMEDVTAVSCDELDVKMFSSTDRTNIIKIKLYANKASQVCSTNLNSM